MREAGAGASIPSAAPAASTSSRHVAWRAAGSFARARARTASISTGSSGLRADAEGGASSRCAKRAAKSEERGKGGSPVRHS